jgi:hypothetical protein
MPSPGIIAALSTRAIGTQQLGGGGVGKRRWYATIFSFERPRSRSISTERRGRSVSRTAATPRSSSPWPPSCRPLVSRATSVFTPAVPRLHINEVSFMQYTHRLYGVPLKFDRNASTRLVLAQSILHSAIRQRPRGRSPSSRRSRRRSAQRRARHPCEIYEINTLRGLACASQLCRNKRAGVSRDCMGVSPRRVACGLSDPGRGQFSASRSRLAPLPRPR